MEAVVAVPGSKSLSNRYLLLAALADGPSTLDGVLASRDTALMQEALTRCGATFRTEGSCVHVTPLDPENLPQGPVEVFTGLAGTVMRFLPPLAAVLGLPVHVDGDPSARARPMGPVLEAVRQLGSAVQPPDATGLPFSLEPGSEAAPAEVVLDSSGSSQFLSALLLTACLLPEGLTVVHQGAAVPSLPHVEMTLAVLAEYGISVRRTAETAWTVSPGRPRAHGVVVEPDLSNAGPFLVAAAATGGQVAVPGWPQETTQGGDWWRRILPAFGCRVELAEQAADGSGTLRVSGPRAGAAGLRGVDLDLSAAGELAPTVAALCAVAPEPSRLRGIAHLRGHETDRLRALATEINRLGGCAEETADGLRISAPVRHGGLWHSYEDHRMATAGAVVGLVQEGVVVQDIGTTAKTLPGFEALWQQMLDGGGR